MFIPTQEERYAKKSLVTLLLCVIAPAGVYSYFKMVEMADGSNLPIPIDSILGLLNMLFGFTKPVAYLLSTIGVPFGLVWSLLLHLGLATWVYLSARVKTKPALVICVTVGMLDWLLLKVLFSGLPLFFLG